MTHQVEAYPDFDNMKQLGVTSSVHAPAAVRERSPRSYPEVLLGGGRRPDMRERRKSSLLHGMQVHRRDNPSIKFAATHLYTRLETGTVNLRDLGVLPKLTQCFRPGLEPGPLDPETSALTMYGFVEACMWANTCMWL